MHTNPSSLDAARACSRELTDLLRREQGAMLDFLLALSSFDEQRLWAQLGFATRQRRRRARPEAPGGCAGTRGREALPQHDRRTREGGHARERRAAPPSFLPPVRA